MSSSLSTNREDLTSRLIDSFKDLIAKGVLKPGVKLPPERDLAQRFGVSRSSLRHALKALDMLGIITQRVGDGTYLSSDPARILGEPLEFLFLLDREADSDVEHTRMLVEPALAAMAAEHGTEEVVGHLGDILSQMRAESDHHKLLQLDLHFHDTVFRASGNALAGRLFSVLNRVAFERSHVADRHVDWQSTIQSLQAVYDAIRAHQPDMSRQRMLEHVQEGRAVLSLPKRGEAAAAAPAEPQDFMPAYPMLSRKPAPERPATHQ